MINIVNLSGADRADGGADRAVRGPRGGDVLRLGGLAAHHRLLLLLRHSHHHGTVLSACGTALLGT